MQSSIARSRCLTLVAINICHVHFIQHSVNMSPSGFSRVGLCVYIGWLCVVVDLPTTDGRHQQQQRQPYLEKLAEMKSVVDQMPRDIRELIAEQQQSSNADDYALNSRPVHIIPGTGESVAGITSLGERLYVARADSQHLDVYDIDDYTPRPQIPLPASLITVTCLAASPANNRVYVSNWIADEIYIVDLPRGNAVSTWSVSGRPVGIDVKTNGNVLVAFNVAQKIREYTADGQLVREIEVHGQPWCVVQLPGGDSLGVTLFDSYSQVNRYCVLQGADRVVCHEGDLVSVLAFGVAVDERGRAYVADFSNGRIVMLEPDTLIANVLPLDGGITMPRFIHLDESRGRLYVGEPFDQQRVVVFAV